MRASPDVRAAMRCGLREARRAGRVERGA
jgi:hypothetical protein